MFFFINFGSCKYGDYMGLRWLEYLFCRAECSIKDKVDDFNDLRRRMGLGCRFCDCLIILIDLIMIVIKICFGKKYKNF